MQMQNIKSRSTTLTIPGLAATISEIGNLLQVAIWLKDRLSDVNPQNNQPILYVNAWDIKNELDIYSEKNSERFCCLKHVIYVAK